MKCAMGDGVCNLKETLAVTIAGYEIFRTKGRGCNQGKTELAKKEEGCHETLAAPQR